MKKVMNRIATLAFCAAMSISFAACSDDDNNSTPAGGDEPQEPSIPEFTSEWTAEGYYKGDYYDNGSGNVFVGLTENSLVFDEDEEDYTGDGKVIVIDFNTVLAQNPDFATISEGDYVAAETNAEGTINLDSESYITFYSGTTSQMLDVTEGQIKVTPYGDGIYALEGTLTTEDGTETEVKFVGKIPIYNRTDEGCMSNLTGNVEINTFSQGAALYGGMIFTESSDYYMVMIAEKDYNLDFGYGSGRALYLGLNVTPGSTDGIPSGTYNLISIEEADDYDPFTALDGFYMPYYGGYYGAWYFHTYEGIEAAARTGSVTVTNKGNNIYTVTFDLKDGHGNSITGTYNGALDLYDAS